jgi:hypothetical protein
MINPAKETYDPIEAIPAGKGIAPCVIQFPYLDIIIDLDQGGVISVIGWRLSRMAPISEGT